MFLRSDSIQLQLIHATEGIGEFEYQWELIECLLHQLHFLLDGSKVSFVHPSTHLSNLQAVLESIEQLSVTLRANRLMDFFPSLLLSMSCLALKTSVRLISKVHLLVQYFVVDYKEFFICTEKAEGFSGNEKQFVTFSKFKEGPNCSPLL